MHGKIHNKHLYFSVWVSMYVSVGMNLCLGPITYSTDVAPRMAMVLWNEALPSSRETVRKFVRFYGEGRGRDKGRYISSILFILAVQGVVETCSVSHPSYYPDLLPSGRAKLNT